MNKPESVVGCGGEEHASLPLPDDFECMATWEELSLEDGNYCEYRTQPSGSWHASKFSAGIVRKLLKESFQTYLTNVEKATKDCAAAVRRLVLKGPPIYLEDKNALPLPENGDTHIDLLWFSDDKKYASAVLVGALQGEEREKLWETQKEVLQAMEAAETQEDKTV
uniref:Uncharacterized protein n=1 Tax=Aplanochytrium stocchinoi TaxID=215587 RepID=A0A7S3LSW9_9STRA|mmetsp:Transcript_17107/g.21073  ORF Transcript_17107/g.21073 Transcript_17107/m.21073 type:complete len:166 (-) Transcript_17107:71-568(-)|eukprot:CAMPEP_0204831244 /NCGR_PEP_ID=MMETSP1346-20131115/10214_1 /ASSEMBLY_ACC=CAM_ASM_000771 /TAXON_ID=215587 /ORGANISM="Aplanochytrium stocchinoi, Strain GSBS06" /LENGTH=165 /DNA_ID=CAMNT_0051962121 /DNA_START=96 /DNA_END=593 /DNA_ORIENTATION=-